ncbi:substrate import-associated zinc metallohydrolase lipoprotein [Sphingobacterium yanglingense]|uniref:Substrate import-associated zinc metallohydrolase lipoprotein n=1 Tax=Sphingobacterium yanglingense TaxID=1437280 RepID=A0A4R6W4K1_9SPHI|nr:substrate import-associated zinc metallohydrolase lipoprotein [Sphingobacterium yanglingense]TDQ73518.1 substrate import-associated zinc metallohydrolase lipoprotein [Sphingobacterium yanglingense]
MNMRVNIFLIALVLAFVGCKKDNYPLGEIDETVDYFSKKQVKPKSQWNELDYLCDSIQKAYGVEIIYEYTPRIIEGTTFFMPPQYDKALPYTRVMLDKMWLKPIKELYPKFFKEQTPIEFILAGGFVHFNDPTTTAGAAGAGMNGQYYRLGMGGVNNFSLNKNWLWDHIVTLYHEHAHQIDHKYGRSERFDRVSQGRYYGIPGYAYVTTQEARADGFWTGYGGYAPEEDFATTVEYMLRLPKAAHKAEIEKSKSAALETKYKMLHQRYLDMGVDLHELQVVLDSVARKVNY